MARSRHEMPFGSAVLDDGRVRFRLWAPAARHVELCLDPGDARVRRLTMAAEPGGWFALATTDAKAGSRYLYRIDGGQEVPDPASRFQPDDVHGASEVIDPLAWRWTDTEWTGRPWHEAVIYELHVGAFSPDGDFAGVQARLDYLVQLGVTAIELMPVADFPGRHNWGYDAAALFAPDSRYGRPERLKSLVHAAHARGVMMLLDVVYNHFGPEGNYLALYAPQFFTSHHRTPWGAAINYGGRERRWVREFIVHNALYWLEEYHFDGLRIDAAHAIRDESHPDILTELAERVHDAFRGRRRVHLVLENDRNAAHYLNRDPKGEPRWFTAQWNDDLHHALHVLVTAETQGYYLDYAADPLRHLARCLTEGFAYQGERSAYRNGARRGEPSVGLPPQAFVGFVQNHDQIGNRAFGERIDALSSPARVHAAAAIVLLMPSPALLFMGQEWGCRRSFPFFCDFSADIAAGVTAGRRREFARFPAFRDAAVQRRIPNPTDGRTFESAVLDWSELENAAHAQRLQQYRRLLAVRHRDVLPHLAHQPAGAAQWLRLSAHGLLVHWTLADRSILSVLANLADSPLADVTLPRGRALYSTHALTPPPGSRATVPPWCVAWYLQSSEPPA